MRENQEDYRHRKSHATCFVGIEGLRYAKPAMNGPLVMDVLYDGFNGRVERNFCVPYTGYFEDDVREFHACKEQIRKDHELDDWAKKTLCGLIEDTVYQAHASGYCGS